MLAKKKTEKDTQPEPVEDEKATEAPAIPKPVEGSFLAELAKWDSQEPVLTNEADADRYVAALQSVNWTVTKIEQKNRNERPQPPFTTTTLQHQPNLRRRFTASPTINTPH